MPRSGVRGFSSSVLRMARADAGLRVDELARLLGVSQQAVAMWETGRSKPTPAMLAALAHALNLGLSRRCVVTACQVGRMAL